MKIVRAIFTAICFSYVVVSGFAANYFVALTGDDLNAGTETSPWRTIQKAASTMVAGDRVTVATGNYDERISTVRGGTAETNRIEFHTSGLVTMRGFSIKHPYVSISGFDITRHSSSNVYDAYVEVEGTGDFFVLQNNRIRDGIHYVSTNVSFQNNGIARGTITCPSGGFLAAGFKPGQTIRVERASSATLLNNGTEIIAEVTDNMITVSGALSDDGPKPAYITGSYVYGLVVLGGAQNCIFNGNAFTNLSFDGLLIGGSNNQFVSNRIEYLHGWDVMHFMGTNHVFRGNYIKRNPLVVYQVSPDVFENWPTTYANILFENNFIESFAGVLGSLKTSPTRDSRDLVFRNNVFVDVGRFVAIYTNTTFANNTFLRVAASANPVTSMSPHALTFIWPSAANSVAVNNIFVGCGEGRSPDLQGWFEFNGDPSTAQFVSNFVSGAGPEFARKGGYIQDPVLNGGDPGFVNIDDPVGPDGIPFTADDGLRLRLDSKLRGAGVNGEDLGAYSAPAAPQLFASLEDGVVRLSWASAFSGYVLQSASSPSGAWESEDALPVENGDTASVTIQNASGNRFFRLIRETVSP